MRRKTLIDFMKSNEEQGNDCSKCSGLCCTFVSNSMMITPIETKEIYDYLLIQNMLDSELIAKFKDAVTKYRLDYDLGTGRKSLRRTYTCPFFMHKSLGCPLPQEIKPYGCLAFNPNGNGVLDGENCSSNKDNLVKRDDDNKVEELRLNKYFQFNWAKLPIPLALLKYHESIEKVEDKHR